MCVFLTGNILERFITSLDSHIIGYYAKLTQKPLSKTNTRRKYLLVNKWMWRFVFLLGNIRQWFTSWFLWLDCKKKKICIACWLIWYFYYLFCWLFFFCVKKYTDSGKRILCKKNKSVFVFQLKQSKYRAWWNILFLKLQIIILQQVFFLFVFRWEYERYKFVNDVRWLLEIVLRESYFFNCINLQIIFQLSLGRKIQGKP